MKTFLPAILAFALLASLPARATEMPADLNPPARVQAPDLNRVETAELARSDENQKGGDAVVAIVVIAAIVALVYIFFEHMDRMETKR